MPYRDSLPPVPFRMRGLPTHRGYPVPWFVQWIDGVPDFRVIDRAKLHRAIVDRRCWICGAPLMRNLAFVLGPMCAVNRTNSEPPSHRECAEFAIRGCPFLNQSESRRNAANLPDVGGFSAYGIDRQPGVALLWMTHSYDVFTAPDTTILFTVGAPIDVQWYAHGRPATRQDVIDSIASGMPILRAMAETEGPDAIAELERARDRAWLLLPED